MSDTDDLLFQYYPGPVESFMGSTHDIQTSRGPPLLPAKPLSQFVQDCFEFLTRIQTIQVVGGDKKRFQLHVELCARNDANRTLSFEITRSKEEIAMLQQEISNACRHHPRPSQTGLEPCALCTPLKIIPPLPDSLARRFSHTASIHQVIEDRLNYFLTSVKIPPTDADKFYCEGQVSVPVALRNFLLRGVDDIVALK